MRKIRIKRYRKFKILAIIIVLLSSSFLATRSFNRYMEPQLLAIAKQHAGFAINNIVKEVLADMEFNQKDIVNIQKNNDGTITNIDYDSARLNQILYTALNTIDASLLAAQDGRKDPTTKDVFYEDGVLYEVPMGYFSHLYFLYEKGPKVKIKMKMMNDVTGEIKTETKPYGINNTMVKISLVVHVNAQVLTFLSTSELNNKCEIPIIIQVVNGSVPNISPYGATNE
ncbi:sporulation protein YunB [Amedibacillus sp. YH-ame6]